MKRPCDIKVERIVPRLPEPVQIQLAASGLIITETMSLDQFKRRFLEAV